MKRNAFSLVFLICTLLLTGCKQNTALRNTISLNGYRGIDIISANYALIDNNTIIDNDDSGIFTNGHDVISNNYIHGNHADGIRVSAPTSPIMNITGNTIDSNFLMGVNVVYFSTASCANSQIFDNYISNHGGYGLSILGYCTGGARWKVFNNYFNNTLNASQFNSFSVKLLYYIDYQNLKRKT